MKKGDEQLDRLGECVMLWFLKAVLPFQVLKIGLIHNGIDHMIVTILWPTCDNLWPG